MNLATFPRWLWDGLLNYKDMKISNKFTTFCCISFFRGVHYMRLHIYQTQLHTFKNYKFLLVLKGKTHLYNSFSWDCQVCRESVKEGSILSKISTVVESSKNLKLREQKRDSVESQSLNTRSLFSDVMSGVLYSCCSYIDAAAWINTCVGCFASWFFKGVSDEVLKEWILFCITYLTSPPQTTMPLVALVS